jgi:hypothetical protein
MFNILLLSQFSILFDMNCFRDQQERTVSAFYRPGKAVKKPKTQLANLWLFLGSETHRLFGLDKYLSGNIHSEWESDLIRISSHIGKGVARYLRLIRAIAKGLNLSFGMRRFHELAKFRVVVCRVLELVGQDVRRNDQIGCAAKRTTAALCGDECEADGAEEVFATDRLVDFGVVAITNLAEDCVLRCRGIGPGGDFGQRSVADGRFHSLWVPPEVVVARI